MLSAAAVLAVGSVALTGLGFAVYLLVANEPTSTEAAANSQAGLGTMPSGPHRRDSISAEPMLQVSAQDGRGGVPSSTPAPSLTIPAATEIRASEVPSGFPPTPQGAIGQLAAIEITVLQGMSIPIARDVYEHWSEPGPADASDWELMRNVQAFLGSAAGTDVEDPTTMVVAEPVGAQIKGSDGAGWVVACVLLDVRAMVATEARVAYGHCARMVWEDSERRWVIGAGEPPARAPSTWPGTDLAARAGWRTWISERG
ncbi:hypothetical protein Cch01nite_40380 [Cellulomonas chitinilytica]|uniref:Uncharacterized protein n=2 Tax=Cellulomonas chitinilytica TaxID=398759 RepID=A0A919P8P3_9CELL|nr:hypothetical protein Cch01nite_40380 [Cellulomonas chitinilytica]